MNDGWFWAAGRIVGNTHEWTTVYASDCKLYPTRGAAISAGFKRADASDDFNVGRVVSGELVWFGWMDEQHPVDEYVEVAADLRSSGVMPVGGSDTPADQPDETEPRCARDGATFAEHYDKGYSDGLADMAAECDECPHPVGAHLNAGCLVCRCRHPVLADQPEPNCAECGVGEATKDCVEGCRERKDCQSCAAGDHYRARNDAVCLCCGEPRPTPDDQREKECAYCGELESNCTGSRHSFLPLGPMRA